MKFIILIGTIWFIQVANCNVVPEPVTEPSILVQIAKQAEDALNELHTKFLDFWGVKSNNELADLVQTQSKAYATKLQEIFGEISDEARKGAGKFDDVVKDIQEKLNETVRDIETKNQEFFADTKKYQEHFETQLRAVLQETEKFNSKLKLEGEEFSQHLGKMANSLYETTVETAKAFTTQVENVVMEKKN